MIGKLLKKDKRYNIGEHCLKYCVKEILGEGRYGIAYLGEGQNGEKVVIKQLKNAMLKEIKEKVRFEKEILQGLDNIAFPKFIGEFNEENRKGYILEFKEGKTFEELIYKDEYIFSKKEIFNTCKKLIDLIAVLEEKNIVHKDIRVSNIIILEGGNLALIDFGLARFIDNEKYTEDLDFWYLGDFLLHLYYTSYTHNSGKSKPWYDELNISEGEKSFIKRLMKIEKGFSSLKEVKRELENLEEYIDSTI